MIVFNTCKINLKLSKLKVLVGECVKRVVAHFMLPDKPVEVSFRLSCQDQPLVSGFDWAVEDKQKITRVNALDVAIVTDKNLNANVHYTCANSARQA